LTELNINHKGFFVISKFVDAKYRKKNWIWLHEN